MNREEVDGMLKELLQKIDSGPGSHSDALKQVVKQHVGLKEFKGIIAEINESFNVTRLVIKYLMFDVEATSRERDQLRMLLEDKD
jgi:hypothetical protein